MAIDDAELAYAGWLADEEKTRQENVVLAQDYYDGHQDVQLTDRQEEFLGFQDSGRFAINYCRMVVDAVVERLLVQNFTSENEDWAAAAWDWWKANQMGGMQHAVHLGAVRDREFFVFVDWDEEAGEPRFIPHPRYTSPMVGGSGFGCKAFYVNDYDRRRMTKASKRWTETVTNENGQRETRQRMTVYYPGRIVRYVMRGSIEGGWEELETVPWVDEGGEPLGIPIVHFQNPGGKSEIWDAIPIQDGINKTAVDILAAADASGFRVFFAKGFYPTTDGKEPEDDGGNYLEIFPGCLLGHPDTDADLEAIEGTDLGSLLDGLDSLIVKLAQVTDTPTSRLQLTGQVASEGTQKAGDIPLLSKVRLRQEIFGNRWERMLKIARRLANQYGRAGLPEDAGLETQWRPAETSDEKDELETLELKSKLGVPMEQLWAEMGYDQDEIARMKAMRGEQLAEQSNVGGELLRAFERGA